MAGISGFFKSIFGICETKPLSPDLWGSEQNKVRLKLEQIPELSQRGGAVYLKDQGLQTPVLVVRTMDDRYLAFANSCPHGKRKIDPLPGEPALRCCSVGYSKFDYEGNVLKGPAKDPLKRYDVELSGGELVISL
ncbi:MAG: Rieske 2Fe-2S domain-containing protein [Chloroflexota bacterium]|nr:Rieske 2Fe-2S domain-containing protein [Chloroflexota bacterium]